VIVATRLWRKVVIGLSLLGIQYSSVMPMCWDNRYFPLFEHMYTGADSRESNLDTTFFVIKGGDAFRFQSRANKEELAITFPELWGELDLVQVANSMVKAGEPNPLPDDWLWLSEIKAFMPASIEGQGGIISGFVPFLSHFGIGGSIMVQQLNNFVSVVPGNEAISKLNLNTPGNQAVFMQTMQRIYQTIGINSTASQSVGVGDIVLYASLHDTHEYKYKFHKLDWGVLGGIIIPNGLKQDFSNLASLPFGGMFGGWAWFLVPRAEFELRDDLIFGFQARIIQRFDHCAISRIPFGNENMLFAPKVGQVYIDQGTTYSVAPYFVFQNIRAGLGVQLQYTITGHEHDYFSSNCIANGNKPQFCEMNYYSAWTQEYFTFKLFYDIGYDKNWKNKPSAYFIWDIPMNHVAGKGFARTNRVSIGCNINF